MIRKQVLRFFLMFFVVVPCSFLGAAPKIESTLLGPDNFHRQATKLITGVIGQYHYRNVPLDDKLSEAVLDRYIQSLDPSHIVFMKEDIASFAKYKTLLDDALNTGDIEAAFEIFRVYRTRLASSVDYAINLLNQKFDFDIDENFDIDRKEASWPKNLKELNELWRKRVKNDILNLHLAGKTTSEATETLTKRYQRLSRYTNQYKAEDVYEIFVNAYLQSIEPHTAYFSPRTSENFKINMSLSLEGIGAVLHTENEHTMVGRVIPGGPADMSDSLHADDRIIGVAQGNKEIVDVVGWRLGDVVDLIRGPKRTTVRLEILTKNTPVEGPSKTITIIRDRIKLEEQAAKKTIIDRPMEGGTLRIAIIDLPTFYMDFEARERGDKDFRSTTRDVRKLLEEIKAEKVDGVVIDLRGNGGGSLMEATSLTGLFIETGPIVQIKDMPGTVNVLNDPDPGITYTGPLAVLVDRRSASASEIFAGAIKDYKRGIIIGEPTFGKGTVQNMTDLSQLLRQSPGTFGRLKFTTAQFFRINGDSTQNRGVIPDIVFPTAIDSVDQGESALDNALPWARIKAAEFKPYDQPSGDFLTAKQQHEKRITSNRGFALLMEQQDLIRKARDRTVVSLLEPKRKSERDAVEKAMREKENQYRSAEGMKLLVDGEERDEEDDIDFNGILSSEAAQILADLIAIDLQRSTAKLVAGQQHKPVTHSH